MRAKHVLMAEAPETPPGGDTPPVTPPAGNTPAGNTPAGNTPAGNTPPATPPASDAPPATPPATPPAIKLELPNDSKLAQSDIDRIAATARERGLSQEQATALLTEADTAARGFEGRLLESVKAKHTEWVAAVAADPELGGAKLETTKALAQRTVDKFMSQSLRDELKTTGYGDHPELVRFLAKVGAALGEDTPPAGDKPAQRNKAPEDVLYGSPKN
jgi:hypothetical protein